MQSQFRISQVWRLAMALLLVVSFSWVVMPAHSQSASVTIESDDARVQQSGTWSTQATASASGGGYLYSGGAEGDVLTLEFSGPSLEVIYVAGPSLGTLAIEVDGTVLRTVITTQDQTAYAQAARVDYLTDEPHELKVYAQEGGVVAIDAFVIPPALISEPAGEVNNVENPSDPQITPCTPVNTIHRVSLDERNEQVNGATDPSDSALSDDGRFVVFESFSSELVVGDTNGMIDIFLYDRNECEITRVSVANDGSQAVGGHSLDPDISGDGRYIVYESFADGLVAADSNGVADVYMYDRLTYSTTRISRANLAFPQSNGASTNPTISSDGTRIVFESVATNLVSSDTNGESDIFLRDLAASTTTRLSLRSNGNEAVGGGSFAADISAAGTHVAFESEATNLVANDTNADRDIFVHEISTADTSRVSLTNGGSQAQGNSWSPAISSNGNIIAFESDSAELLGVNGDTNLLRDVFVRVRTGGGSTSRISITSTGAQATSASLNAKIGNGGRYIAFESDANLVPEDTANSDIYVYDRTLATVTLVSVAADGTKGNDNTSYPAIAGSGSYVSYESEATNLIDGDTNSAPDIYVTPRFLTPADNLALFNPTFQIIGLVDTLADPPPASTLTFYSAYAPVTGGEWVMGDWDGDGLETPGVYTDGPFYYTNEPGETDQWSSLWIGVVGQPVAGRLSATVDHDCVGAVQSANFPPFGLAFVLYYTCDLSGNTAPAISNQWLSVLLPDSGGFTGTHQFSVADLDGDDVETIACRRGTYIAWTNDAATTGAAGFPLAQYIGAPATTDEGYFVAGDFDGDTIGSFGLYYQSGEFYYRHDLDFNSGVYVNQTVGNPFSGTTQATTWR